MLYFFCTLKTINISSNILDKRILRTYRYHIRYCCQSFMNKDLIQYDFKLFDARFR